MEMWVFAKLALLVAAIWFWYINIAKTIRGQSVSAANMLIASAALVGFVYMQGWLS